MRLRSVAARMALATMLVSVLAVATVALGVIVIGSAYFDLLMTQAGESVDMARQMFNESVRVVVIVASAVAIGGSILLAVVFARVVERPLNELARAAREVAAGSYEHRVHRPGAPELASVADSFNQMAEGLGDQERQRRELILNFAHELRTPLTNLHGYLEGLKDGVVAPGPAVFASLQDEVARLHRLSRSLDDLAAAGFRAPAEPERIELAPTVQALLELGRSRFAQRRITARSEVRPGLWVRTDPDALAQVLGNLIQNAARYTETGGRVWVRAQAEAGSVLVTVANTGPGIPAEDLPHVFERFHRVEKSRSAARGGAGIGLAIVKQLVEGRGGEVGAESAAGVTHVWFRLPA